MTPATYAPNSRSDYLAVGRALTAAAACRQLALLGKSARGDALQVYLHTLLDTRKGEAVIDSHYLRGQTVFPATKDHLVHVDMVTHRWCARLVQQRPNSITTRGDWAACPVQPGRYGDQTNGSSGYKVLAPANGALFGWAVFCTAAEAVLEQIDTQVHASPGNLTRQNA